MNGVVSSPFSKGDRTTILQTLNTTHPKFCFFVFFVFLSALEERLRETHVYIIETQRDTARVRERD